MIGITLRGATSGDFSTLADTPKWGRVEAVFGGRWGSCAKRLLARPPGGGESRRWFLSHTAEDRSTCSQKQPQSTLWPHPR